MEENMPRSREKYLKYKQKYFYLKKKKNMVGGTPEEEPSIESFFDQLYNIFKATTKSYINMFNSLANCDLKIIKNALAGADIGIFGCHIKKQDRSKPEMAESLIQFIHLFHQEAFTEFRLKELLRVLRIDNEYMKGLPILIQDLKKLHDNIIANKNILLPYFKISLSTNIKTTRRYIDVNEKPYFEELDSFFQALNWLFKDIAFRNSQYKSSISLFDLFTHIIEKIIKNLHNIDLLFHRGFDIFLYDFWYCIDENLKEILLLAESMPTAFESQFNENVDKFKKQLKEMLNKLQPILILN